MHYLTEELSEEFNLYIKRANPVLLGMEVTAEFRGRQIDVDYMLETRRHSTSHPILRSICRSILAGKSRYEIDYENLGSVLGHNRRTSTTRRDLFSDIRSHLCEMGSIHTIDKPNDIYSIDLFEVDLRCVSIDQPLRG